MNKLTVWKKSGFTFSYDSIFQEFLVFSKIQEVFFLVMAKTNFLPKLKPKKNKLKLLQNSKTQIFD